VQKMTGRRGLGGRLAWLGVALAIPATILLAAGCASKNAAQGGGPNGSSSSSAPTSAPTSAPGGSTHTVTHGPITAPHIMCMRGAHDYTFDGSKRASEICIGASGSATIRVQIPAGQHWQAPRVSDPGMLVASGASADGSLARITVRAVETGSTTITISDGRSSGS
jgi:hypothetical protein